VNKRQYAKELEGISAENVDCKEFFETIFRIDSKDSIIMPSQSTFHVDSSIISPNLLREFGVESGEGNYPRLAEEITAEELLGILGRQEGLQIDKTFFIGEYNSLDVNGRAVVLMFIEFAKAFSMCAVEDGIISDSLEENILKALLLHEVDIVEVLEGRDKAFYSRISQMKEKGLDIEVEDIAHIASTIMKRTIGDKYLEVLKAVINPSHFDKLRDIIRFDFGDNAEVTDLELTRRQLNYLSLVPNLLKNFKTKLSKSGGFLGSLNKRTGTILQVISDVSKRLSPFSGRDKEMEIKNFVQKAKMGDPNNPDLDYDLSYFIKAVNSLQGVIDELDKAKEGYKSSRADDPDSIGFDNIMQYLAMIIYSKKELELDPGHGYRIMQDYIPNSNFTDEARYLISDIAKLLGKQAPEDISDAEKSSMFQQLFHDVFRHLEIRQKQDSSFWPNWRGMEDFSIGIKGFSGNTILEEIFGAYLLQGEFPRFDKKFYNVTTKEKE